MEIILFQPSLSIAFVATMLNVVRIWVKMCRWWCKPGLRRRHWWVQIHCPAPAPTESLNTSVRCCNNTFFLAPVARTSERWELRVMLSWDDLQACKCLRHSRSPPKHTAILSRRYCNFEEHKFYCLQVWYNRLQASSRREICTSDIFLVSYDDWNP